jgi:hypothetical protein
LKIISIFGSLFLVFTFLAACGDSPTPAPASTVEVTRIVEVTKLVEVTKIVTVQVTQAAPTTALAPTTANATTPAATTALPATTIASTTPPSSGNFNPDVSELVGQSGQYKDMKIKISRADKYAEIQGVSKTAKSQGAFIVIQFDIDNTNGKEPASYFPATLVDNKNRSFSGSTNSDVYIILALDEPYKSKYKTDIPVQPGFKGQFFNVFEVPTDATGFKIKIGF